MGRSLDSSALTEILKNAPGNPVIWDWFLSRLAEITACDTSYLLITDRMRKENTRFLFSFNLPKKIQKQIISEFINFESFNNLLTKNPCQVISSNKIPLKIECQLSNDLNFQNYFGFSIPCNSHHSLILCINRKTSFSTTEQQRIRRLLFSIITPLSTAIEAELQQKIYSQILLHTHVHFDSYVIIDPVLNILYSDSVFSSVIRKIGSVKVIDERIEFNNPELEPHLSFLISVNQVAPINNPSDICQITLIPVSSLDNLYGWEFFEDSYILAFTYNRDNNPTLGRLINIHKLSKCEALCALDFIQTPSIVEIAENTCRSQNTIRNHIKHIMHKMDVHNQAALMKKLVSLTAL